MIKTNVKSLPLFEVIADIAEEFNVTTEENCGEYRLDIPPHIGEGEIRGIDFEGGIGIIIYDCTFKEDIEFHFVVDDVHPLKFLYCLEGSLNHRFQDGKEDNTIEQYQSSIVASQNRNGHILHFTANEPTRISSLEINRGPFIDKLSCQMADLDDKLQSLFKDKEASEQFYHNGYFSLSMSDLFRDLQKFEHNDFIRRMFLEGIAYRILTYQIVQYHDDLNDENKRSILRQSEVSQIKNAALIIENELGQLETLEVLADRIGLNINKLQQGFKHLYSMTANEYIQDQRLSLAKRLMNNTDLNISEIVDRIGLSSKSYFSKKFKEAYGISPSEYRNSHYSKR